MMNIIQLKSENCRKNYRVLLGTSSFYPQEFHVCANDKDEALNLVGDYCEENGLHTLYSDRYEIADLCKVGETVEEHAAALHMTCCGKHGVYVELFGIEEM
jgi:hypothetical protein